MLSSGSDRKNKRWHISRQNSRFPIVGKWDSAVCSVTNKLKQEQLIQMKNQKATKLWKHLEKNLKEPYHQNIQDILNLKMWENGTAQCHQQAQTGAVLTNFRLCNVEFLIQLKNQKMLTKQTKQNSRFPNNNCGKMRQCCLQCHRLSQAKAIFMDCRLLNVNFRIQMKNQKTTKQILWNQHC